MAVIPPWDFGSDYPSRPRRTERSLEDIITRRLERERERIGERVQEVDLEPQEDSEDFSDEQFQRMGISGVPEGHYEEPVEPVEQPVMEGEFVPLTDGVVTFAHTPPYEHIEENGGILTVTSASTNFPYNINVTGHANINTLDASAISVNGVDITTSLDHLQARIVEMEVQNRNLIQRVRELEDKLRDEEEQESE